MIPMRLLAILGVAVAISGCVSFQRNPEMNKIISPYWSDRDYAPAGGVGPNNGELSSYISRVAYKGGDGKWHVVPVIAVKGTAQWKVVTDPTNYYSHSIFDSKYQGDLTLPAVKLDLDAQKAYDYEIRDVAHVIVPPENTPDRASVAAIEGVPQRVPLYWIRAAGLTTVKFTTATTISSSGTITGTGFSNGESTYNSSSLAEFYPLVSFDVVPMNDLADAEIAAKPPVLPPTTKVEVQVTTVSSEGATSVRTIEKAFEAPANEPKSKWKARLTGGTRKGEYLSLVVDEPVKH